MVGYKAFDIPEYRTKDSGKISFDFSWISMRFAMGPRNHHILSDKMRNSSDLLLRLLRLRHELSSQAKLFIWLQNFGLLFSFYTRTLWYRTPSMDCCRKRSPEWVDGTGVNIWIYCINLSRGIYIRNLPVFSTVNSLKVEPQARLSSTNDWYPLCSYFGVILLKR